MKIYKSYGSKERLLEMFQNMRVLNENEIDKVNYKMLFDALIKNTEIIKDKILDDIAYRTDDFIKNNIVSIEELSDLYKSNIIQNLDGFPIIDNSDYLNYNIFINKVKEALNR
jgi:hypothetical protein